MVVSRMSSRRSQNVQVQVQVLAVEDHVALASRVGEGLRDAGFAVDVVYDGAAALQSTVSTGCDVVVLDRDLPRQLPGSAGVNALIDALGRGGPLSQ